MKIDTEDPVALRAHLAEIAHFCTVGIKHLRRSCGPEARARVSELLLLRKAASAFKGFPPSRDEVQEIEHVAYRLIGSERAEDADMRARFDALMQEDESHTTSPTSTTPDRVELAEIGYEPGSFAEAMAVYDEECICALVEFCRLVSASHGHDQT